MIFAAWGDDKAQFEQLSEKRIYRLQVTDAKITEYKYQLSIQLSNTAKVEVSHFNYNKTNKHNFSITQTYWHFFTYG